MKKIIIILCCSLPLIAAERAEKRAIEHLADVAVAARTKRVELSKEVETENPKEFICKICKATFTTKRGLGQHSASCVLRIKDLDAIIDKALAKVPACSAVPVVEKQTDGSDSAEPRSTLDNLAGMESEKQQDQSFKCSYCFMVFRQELIKNNHESICSKNPVAIARCRRLEVPTRITPATTPASITPIAPPVTPALASAVRQPIVSAARTAAAAAYAATVTTAPQVTQQRTVPTIPATAAPILMQQERMKIITDVIAAQYATVNNLRQGTTALHEAVLLERADLIDLLCQHGADLNIRNAQGNSPIYEAVIRGISLDIIKHLLLNGENRAWCAAFLILLNKLKDDSIENKEKLVTTFADSGYPLTRKDSQDNTFLHLGIWWFQPGTIKFLVEHGLQPNEINQPHGQTPLHVFVRNAMFQSNGKDLDIVNELLACGANAHAQDKAGNTVFHYIAINKNINPSQLVTLIQRLKEVGLDVNTHNCHGSTALHSAAAAGNTGAITALLDNGADINARNMWGDTPLVISIGKEQENAIKLLLGRGAHIFIDDSSVLAIALMHERYKAAEVINSFIKNHTQEKKCIKCLTLKEQSQLIVTRCCLKLMCHECVAQCMAQKQCPSCHKNL